MYKNFCKCIDNYLIVHDVKSNPGLSRIFEPLKLLANPGKYQEEKSKNTELYRETSNLYFCLNKRKTELHPFKYFVECILWGSGYEMIEDKSFDLSVVDRQILILKVLLVNSRYLDVENSEEWDSAIQEYLSTCNSEIQNAYEESHRLEKEIIQQHEELLKEYNGRQKNKNL